MSTEVEEVVVYANKIEDGGGGGGWIDWDPGQSYNGGFYGGQTGLVNLDDGSFVLYGPAPDPATELQESVASGVVESLIASGAAAIAGAGALGGLVAGADLAVLNWIADQNISQQNEIGANNYSGYFDVYNPYTDSVSTQHVENPFISPQGVAAEAVGTAAGEAIGAMLPGGDIVGAIGSGLLSGATEWLVNP